MPTENINNNSLTALGVRRPVLIAVTNLLIILAGFAAILGVDVRELPNVDQPVVSVRATYQGASPETMDTEVTNLVEAAVARVAGLKSINSSSEEGSMRLRAEFNIGVDLNTAANDIREAVSRVQRQLPEDVDELQVIKADDDARDIMQLSAFSDTLTKYELAQRIEKEIVPELVSVEGVAEVRLNGDQPLTLRILIDPAKMAGYKLSMTDLIEALRNTRYDVPVGSYKSEGKELIVRAYASEFDTEKIKQLHVRDNIRIGDVADVLFAPQDAESFSLLNGRMVIGMGIVRQAGSNTIAISNEINERIASVNERTKDFQISINSDDAEYITGALTEVYYSLLMSIIIVLIVIAIFLGQWRTTLIPAVTIPVSLIGTVAAIWALGFSVNLLTLLALVLATGLVVDDAIIVIENIQRLRSKKIDKMAAAVLGTKQVFFAVIATTATLVAVFLPIAFLPGQTGAMFREFGIVLAISVIISSFVAVTICPMMASRIPHLSGTNPYIIAIRDRLNAVGQSLSGYYFTSLNFLLARPLLTLFGALVIAAGGIIGFLSLNQELLPSEDRGAINISITGPDGASLAYTDEQARAVENALQPYKEAGIITNIFAIVGRWDKNRAYVTGMMAPWGERDINQIELAERINKEIGALPGAQVRVIQSSSLNVRQSGGGLELAVLGNNYEDLSQTADKLAEALESRLSYINDVRVQFDTSQPELTFNIDRERANDLRVPMDSIADTLRVMVDEYDLMDLSIDDQAVPLVLAPSHAAIQDSQDLLNIFVLNENQELIPISALVNVEEKGVAAELERHAQRRAIELDIGIDPGISLGDSVAEVRLIADEILQPGMSILFLGDAATLEETSYELLLTFIIAFVVIFLVLAAQFESIGSALIVMFTVPFGLAAAVFALLATGQSLNLYSQIGLIMLIGLMTKNAILLVEFMDQMRDEGKTVPEAIIEGARVRLRPLMMTVLSTVLGAMPLILSGGAGAEARHAIGWVIFGGLGLSTLFTLYLAPLGYSLIAPLVKPRAHAGQELERQLKNSEGKDITSYEGAP